MKEAHSAGDSGAAECQCAFGAAAEPFEDERGNGFAAEAVVYSLVSIHPVLLCCSSLLELRVSHASSIRSSLFRQLALSCPLLQRCAHVRCATLTPVGASRAQVLNLTEGGAAGCTSLTLLCSPIRPPMARVVRVSSICSVFTSIR